MSSEISDRNRRILEAIIEDYIDSAEPVGSRSVTRRHSLGISPATVRNVMADLEEMGYLSSPHTSAGRVPTGKGFRFYVDSLLRVREFSDSERLRVEQQHNLKGRRLEELLRDAGKTLSAMSHYTGVVLAPRVAETHFRQIDFVKLSNRRILAIFVSDSGQVQNRLIETEEDYSKSELEQISNYLNQSLSGLSIAQAQARLIEEMAKEKDLYNCLLRRAMRLTDVAFSSDDGDHGELFIEGASQMLDQPEFCDVDQMRNLFRAFEQKHKIVDLLDLSQKAQGIQIFIGTETRNNALEGCSLVTSTYSTPQGSLGVLGVIGPMRMPYSQVIPIVDYTARLLSRVLDYKS